MRTNGNGKREAEMLKTEGVKQDTVCTGHQRERDNQLEAIDIEAQARQQSRLKDKQTDAAQIGKHRKDKRKKPAQAERENKRERKKQSF